MGEETQTTRSDSVAAALVAACAELGPITKGREARVKMKSGGEYRYSYADLGDALETVRPVLAKHGLAVVQDVTSDTDGRVGVITIVLHDSGDELRFGPLFLRGGSDAQQAGSAITYARRYALLAALGLATEDDDGQAASRPPRASQARSEPALDWDALRGGLESMVRQLDADGLEHWKAWKADPDHKGWVNDAALIQAAKDMVGQLLHQQGVEPFAADIGRPPTPDVDAGEGGDDTTPQPSSGGSSLPMYDNTQPF